MADPIQLELPSIETPPPDPALASLLCELDRVADWYQRIGAKGGRNGKYSLAKRESARNAARARWSKARFEKREQSP